MVHRQRRVSEIAYHLWERHGRPEGEAERFWHEAERQFEAEKADAAVDAQDAPSGSARSVAIEMPVSVGKDVTKAKVAPAKSKAKPGAEAKAADENGNRGGKTGKAKAPANDAFAAPPAATARASAVEATVKSNPKADKRKSGK